MLPRRRSELRKDILEAGSRGGNRRAVRRSAPLRRPPARLRGRGDGRNLLRDFVKIARSSTTKTRLARRISAGRCATTMRVIGSRSIRSAIAPRSVSSRLAVPSSRNRTRGWLYRRARQQHALALAARKGRAHVADQRQILHRRPHDVVVHLRREGRRLDPLHVEVGIEERDVVGDRAGQQAVVLRHDADVPAPGAPQVGVGAVAVEVDVPEVGLCRPSRSFNSVVLPPPDVPVMATNSPGSILRSRSCSTNWSAAP